MRKSELFLCVLITFFMLPVLANEPAEEKELSFPAKIPLKTIAEFNAANPMADIAKDDDYWDFGDEDDDYWDCGNGLFIDADGDILYDSDADGEPDSILIDESVCTPDDDSG